MPKLVRNIDGNKRDTIHNSSKRRQLCSLDLPDQVTYLDYIAVFVQFVGSIMQPLVFEALMLRLPVSPVSRHRNG